MATHRPDRVGDQIRQELSELLSRGAVHDPGIGFITLTRVKVSPDLQMARVYYTIARRRSGAAPDREGPRARDRRSSAAVSASACSCGAFPSSHFQFDESVGHQDRVEQILRDLHEEDEQRQSAAVRTAAPSREHVGEAGSDGRE